MSSGLMVTLTGGIANIALFLVLVRTIGADGAGTVILAVAVQSIMFRLTDLGATGAIVRSISSTTNDDGTSTSTAKEMRNGANPFAVAIPPVLLASIGASLALFLLSGQIAGLLAGDTSPIVADGLRYVALGSPVFSLYLLTAHSLKGFESFTSFRLVERVGRPIVYLAIAVLPITSDATDIVALMQISHVGLLILAAISLRSSFQTSGFRWNWSLTDALSFWRFSFPLGVSRLLDSVLTWADTLIISAMLSPAAAATYTTVSRVLLLHSFSVDSATEVGGPRFARGAARNDTEQLKRDFADLTAFQIGTVWPPSIALMIFIPDLLRLADPVLVSGAGAARFICVGAMVASLAGPAVTLRVMMGYSQQLLLISVGVLIVDLTLNLLLLDELGITAAGLAWSGAIVATVWTTWLLGRSAHQNSLVDAARQAAQAASFPTIVASTLWLVTVPGGRPVGAAAALAVGVAFSVRSLLQLRQSANRSQPATL